jgi:energy-coupling factor transporter ATP-binding protein EcfA2
MDARLTRSRSIGRRACCFEGLACFDRADAEYFCGREQLVSDLLARLVESTLVGILGPSGAGKSSLLRAGVLPALSAGVLPGSAKWRQVLLRPGEHPDVELGRTLGGDSLPPPHSNRKAPLSSPTNVRRPPPRSNPAATPCSSSTTTATASPGHCHPAPGSNGPARSPAATSPGGNGPATYQLNATHSFVSEPSPRACIGNARQIRRAGEP